MSSKGLDVVTLLSGGKLIVVLPDSGDHLSTGYLNACGSRDTSAGMKVAFKTNRIM